MKILCYGLLLMVKKKCDAQNSVCLSTLFYVCRFCIHGKRRMWAPCLENELANCVVLVFIFHDVLWDQGPNWWTR